MKKAEILYRQISTEALKGRRSFTQKGLSGGLSISLGNVNKVVSNLARINAVKISRRSFSVMALDKLLLYWATHRNLDSDMVYTVRLQMPVSDIEGSLPDGIAFTAYTAYKKIYGNTPSDYSEVYVYATEDAVGKIKRRFRGGASNSNLFVLKMDEYLERHIAGLERSCVPATQAFVDLWNIRTWYAKEFTDALAKKLFG